MLWVEVWRYRRHKENLGVLKRAEWQSLGGTNERNTGCTQWGSNAEAWRPLAFVFP